MQKNQITSATDLAAQAREQDAPSSEIAAHGKTQYRQKCEAKLPKSVDIPRRIHPINISQSLSIAPLPATIPTVMMRASTPRAVPATRSPLMVSRMAFVIDSP